ncbi:MAG: hypothetical protein R3256_01745 [Thalassovita sp.]|nr:hypothetical protein [Thalassovita sp.]
MTAMRDIPRPELTLPEAEAVALSRAYAGADTILEYGSGGSTVMAAELGKTVWSVESDPDWAQMMRDYFAAHPPLGEVHIVHADIGPTRQWGQPVDDSGWKKFPRYPLAIWDRAGFTHPDVVLVDGRFRVGCALATAFRITRPVTLYFDDYADRERLHAVEDFLGKPVEMIGRMARFDITPTPVPGDKLLRVVKLMMRP